MSDASSAVIERALDRMRAAGAEQADASLVEDESLEVRVRADEIEFVKQATGRGLRLRAFVAAAGGRRQGATETSDFSNAAIDRMAEETVALARATAADPAAGLPDGGFASEVPDLELFDPADRPWKVEERIEAARSIEQAARAVDPRISTSGGSEARSRFARLSYGNTAGFLEHYSRAGHALVSMPIAEAGDEKQGDYWFSRGLTLSDLEDPASVGRTGAERALRRLGARPVATCEVPVIFESRVAASLLTHLFACTSGDAIYRKSSFLVDRLGDRIGSEALNVIDDGRRRAGPGSRPYDAEGLPTRRNPILEQGRLACFLFDSYSARKLGAESTGSSGGDGVAFSNLWLEPGTGSLESLIEDTPRGLLITEMMGSGFNPVTGDYSRGAGGAWIENGRLAQPVQEVTVAGHLEEMLGAVDAIAGDLEWQGPVASPSLRIARMTIGGV